MDLLVGTATDLDFELEFVYAWANWTTAACTGQWQISNGPTTVHKWMETHAHKMTKVTAMMFGETIIRRLAVIAQGQTKSKNRHLISKYRYLDLPKINNFDCNEDNKSSDLSISQYEERRVVGNRMQQRLLASLDLVTVHKKLLVEWNGISRVCVISGDSVADLINKLCDKLSIITIYKLQLWAFNRIMDNWLLVKTIDDIKNFDKLKLVYA
jgi:hypothetical protein